MKKVLLFILLFAGIFSLNAQKKEIEPYIDFLKKQQTDPVDYIFNLFEKYDIVILGERDHRDTVQYVLIDKIISDPRFIEKVGNVFTEVGVNNRKDWINNVLKAGYPSWQAFEDSLRVVYREMDYEILWEKYNYWQFLTSLYKVNRNLTEESKITYYPLDVTYDWQDCKTPEQRKAFKSGLRYPYEMDRDLIMGMNFQRFYSRILKDPAQKRKKALVILNRPHSYRSYDYLHRKERDIYAASVIFASFSDKTANVMLNWDSSQKNGKSFLIHDGKWDAAFRYLGNPSVGFDFAGSPFGDDQFDHYDKAAKGIGYKDVFTGFIFYKPIEDWKCVYGIPGIFDEKFRPELIRRLYLVYPDADWDNEKVNGLIEEYNNRQMTSPYREDTPKDSVDAYINYWLR